MNRVFLWSVIFVVALVSFSSADEPVSDAVGIQVTVVPNQLDPQKADCRIIWTENATAGLVEVDAPLGLEVAIRDSSVNFVSVGHKIRADLSSVRAGTSSGFQLDLAHVSVGESVRVCTERIRGPQRWQLVTRILRTETGFQTETSRGFRITHVVGENTVDLESKDAQVASNDGSKGFFLVESLHKRIDLLDSAFDESSADLSIPDGPTNCANSSTVWPAQGVFYLDSAPAAAVSTAITLHVNISHPVMADLQVAQFYNTNGPGGPGRFLHMQSAGVNMDRDFEQDVFGHSLEGFGQPVNAYYTVGARDCAAGTIGFIDYLSVRVEYDGIETIDLIADMLNPATTEVEPGSNLTVEWWGLVGGSGTVGGAFDTAIYLSQDMNVDGGDALLYRITDNAVNNPGEHFGQGARSLTIPPSTSDGTYYIILNIDDADSISEINENNNTLAAMIDVSTTPDVVDLVADSISVASSSVAPGGTLIVTYAGHVEGTAAVGGAFTNGVYLSADSTISTTDIVLSRQTGAWASNPGDTFGQSSITVTIPASTAAGSYNLGVFIDENNVITESNENNNIAVTFPITVTQAGSPNLEVQSCSLNVSSAAPGEVVTLNWRGLNSGTVASGAFEWSVDLGSGPDTNSSSLQQLAVSTVGGGWAAGHDNSPVAQTGQIPASTPEGNYFIGVKLDTGNVVAESDESDNLCSNSITVTAAGSGGGVTKWLVPAVVSAPGYGTSNWKSQISVANPTSQARIANLYYVVDGGGWPGTLLSGPVTVNANASAFFNDPLLALNPTKGVLYVTLDGSGPVVTSRTFNLAADLSTFGQGIPALEYEGAGVPTELILPMIHSVEDVFHTNLGIVQTSSGSFAVDVSVYDAGGALLASKRYSQATAFRQINDLFSDMNMSNLDREGAWVRVRLATGSPSYWTCYASVIDKVTGDPTYVAAVEYASVK